MDIENILKNKKKIKKIKVTDEGYEMLRIFVDEVLTTNNRSLAPISRFNSIPIEIDNDIKEKMKIIYENEDENIKIVDLIRKIADCDKVPKKIKAGGYVWKYEEAFGQYKNEHFQELIKYLHGDYQDEHMGLKYQIIYNLYVDIIEY